MNISIKNIENYIDEANSFINNIEDDKKIIKDIYAEFRKKNNDNNKVLFSSHLLEQEDEYKFIIEFLKSTKNAIYFLPLKNEVFLKLIKKEKLSKQVFYKEIDKEIYNTEFLFYKYYSYNTDFFITLRKSSLGGRFTMFLINNELLFNTAIPMKNTNIESNKEKIKETLKRSNYNLWENVYKIYNRNIKDEYEFLILRFPSVDENIIKEFYDTEGTSFEIMVLVFKLCVLNQSFLKLMIEEQSRYFLFQHNKKIFQKKYNLIENEERKSITNFIECIEGKI